MSQQAALVSRLDTEALLAEIVDDLTARLPGYGRLDADERGEVETAVRYAVEMVLTTLREGRRPSAAELAPIGEAAAERARQGVPLEEVLHAYRVGPRIAWTHLLVLAEPGENRALAEMALPVMDYVDRAAIVVTRGYLHERDRISVAEDRLYRRLLRALCLQEDRSPERMPLACASADCSPYPRTTTCAASSLRRRPTGWAMRAGSRSAVARRPPTASRTLSTTRRSLPSAAPRQAGTATRTSASSRSRRWCFVRRS
jgi:hypothetical protein